MRYYFPAAPMSKSLKLISFFGTVLILGVSYQAYLAIPPINVGVFTHAFGLSIAALLPLIIFGSLLFMVRGYSVSATHFYIHRLFWQTEWPLMGLQRIEFAPERLKCSIRIFGNGGLFSFTGLYQNKNLGRYRMFVTDFTCAVTLFFADKSVVISPAQPQAFIEFMQTHSAFGKK